MEFIPMNKANLSDHVKQFLYTFIKDMDSNNGVKLPSENELAQKLSVSRVTIRRALDDLEQEGIIFRMHGKGTFINPVALQIQVNLTPGMEFSKLIEESGYKSRFEITRFEIIPADETQAGILQIKVGNPIYIIEKVYFADDHPAIISIDRFSKDLFKDEIELQNSLEQSTFDIIRNKGGRIVTRDKIEIKSMTKKRMADFSASAKYMECDSVLVFHGINYDQDNLPIVSDTEFYNTNFINFNLMRIKNVFDN